MKTSLPLHLGRARLLPGIAALLVLSASASLAPAVQAQSPTATTLYSFGHDPLGQDGAQPLTGLVQGRDGNFYGTTGFGGLGTVFQITPAGAFRTVYQFDSTGNPVDGAGPEGTLALGSDGNFYGTTAIGGTDPSFLGTFFRITPAGVLTTLRSFSSSDHLNRRNGLVQGRDGNFYGTDSLGGANGQGTVFRLTPDGALTILYSFSGNDPAVGRGPLAPLTLGRDGNFYGASFDGKAFQITPAGVLTVLGGTGGNLVESTLIQGSDGNFYGTNNGGGANGYGSVYRLTPAGVLTTLHDFTGTDNDAGDKSGLIQGADGNFYGTTASGSSGGGTVYQITPAGAFAVLHNFTGQGGDGLDPRAGVIQGGDGSFYGTAASGGDNMVGTVFRIGAAAPPVTGQPTVTLSAVVPFAVVGSGQVGEFAVTISSPQPSVVVVHYTVKGSATPGTDYVALSGKAKIKPGKTSKIITIVPEGNLGGQAKRLVKLNLAAGAGYTVGTPAAARVKIVAGQ